jgi:ATP-dependent helicase IRC3
MRAQSLDQAVRASDLYAKTNVVKGRMFLGFVIHLEPLWYSTLRIGFGRLLRRAKWRQEPATENQKAFVKSRWNKAPKYIQGKAENDAGRSLRIQRLTKGEAANIITRIKHGAMVLSNSVIIV